MRARLTRGTLVAVGFGFLVSAAAAQSTNAAAEKLKKPLINQTGSTTLAPVVVSAEEDSAGRTAGFAPDVDGATVFLGKKTTVTHLDELPEVENNNYRQVFSQTPGVYVAEVPNQSTVNLNYRGVGDPHETQDLLVMKDGVPIVMDPFGYSTLYYNPPMQAIRSVSFVRGGASLLYGPQPGPTINYQTYMPSTDKPFTASTEQVFGDYGFYSTFNTFNGTLGRFGYLGYFNHSEWDGQRAGGRDAYHINGGSIKMVLDQKTDSRWIFNVDVQQNVSAEPGRLTLAQYNRDRFQSTRRQDSLEVAHYQGYLRYEKDIDQDRFLTATFWGGYDDRTSYRATSATANTSNIDRREFYKTGTDVRFRQNWYAWDQEHVLTAGFQTYYSSAPRTRQLGAQLDATSGARLFSYDYETVNGAVFVENKFKAGRLSLVPSLRVDVINQDLTKNFNTAARAANSFEDTTATPLGGFGLAYDLGAQNEAYFNFSTGYKPRDVDSLTPTGNNTLPATGLSEAYAWNYELGVRGTPVSWYTYDTSFFLINYEDQFGTVAIQQGGTTFTQAQNVGDAEYRGWEAAMEIDFVGLADGLMQDRNGGPEAGTPLTDRIGSISLFGNVSLLDAEFTSGPLDGNRPKYAPGYMVKFGPIYRYHDIVKLAFTGTYSGRSYWADNNQSAGLGVESIPAFSVWDLSGEAKVYKDYVAVLFGVNNVFDAKYYSRVRPDGIEPASARTFYGGVKVSF